MYLKIIHIVIFYHIPLFAFGNQHGNQHEHTMVTFVPVCRLWCCFQSGTTMHMASMNILMQVFLCSFVILFLVAVILGLKLWGCGVLFDFIVNCQLVLHSNQST